MPGKRARPVRREATRKRTRHLGHLAVWPTLLEAISEGTDTPALPTKR